MRTFLSGVSVLLCGLLLIGAVGGNAPVMQSQNYYINDHAGVVSKEDRDSMLKIAQELYEETGVRAVLLTIENLDGRTPEEYAEAVFNAWEIGANGTGILVLLSTEEKRFATWTNSDILSTISVTEADKLAEEEPFDIAANNCFIWIVYNIYNKHSDNAEAGALDSGAVYSEPPVLTVHEVHKTESANIAEVKKTVFYAVLFLLFIFVFMNFIKKGGPKRRKKFEQSETYYRKLADLGDTWMTARKDDDDYPSGFGGLGNRKAIYLENVDEAEDIGIIKRNNGNAFGNGETGEQKPVN